MVTAFTKLFWKLSASDFWKILWSLVNIWRINCQTSNTHPLWTFVDTYLKNTSLRRLLTGRLKTRDLTSWDHRNWHRETGQCGTISQGWTSRDLFKFRVDAHYKFMFDSRSIIWAAHQFYVCSSISFCFTYCYVRQTQLASSLDNVWAHYKIVIDCVIDRLINF